MKSNLTNVLPYLDMASCHSHLDGCNKRRAPANEDEPLIKRPKNKPQKSDGETPDVIVRF